MRKKNRAYDEWSTQAKGVQVVRKGMEARHRPAWFDSQISIARGDCVFPTFATSWVVKNQDHLYRKKERERIKKSFDALVDCLEHWAICLNLVGGVYLGFGDSNW